ncbi:PTS sugar transporter subunit IIC [Faecalibacillus intestinalis]|uniref:PTS sugar transporter subunit IIC n=1 Tax=Faecalibacillus intestinalis TaxID=1982626 RepID=UPI00352278C3
MEKFMDKLTAFSGKLAKNSAIQTIMFAFMLLLPFSMIGGFAGLFNGIGFESYQQFITSFGLKQVFSVIYQWTVGMFSIYLAFAVGYSFATKNKLEKSAIVIGITSLVCFMIITPFNVPTEAYGAATLPMDWLGSSGMFSSIVISFVVGWIFKLCKKYNISIKLPEQVPPYIANQFTALIPVIVSAILFAFVSKFFSGTEYGSFHQLIYSIIALPIKNLSSNLFGFWIISMMMYALWFFGIHGGMICGPMIMVLFMQMQVENLTAYQNGLALPHMFCGDALTFGSGSLPLLIALLLFAKAKSNRSIAKIALVPSLFGVDEPSYFGIPMIYNPLFFLPWVIIGPTLSVFGTQLFKIIGILGAANGSAGQNAANLPFFVGNTMNYGISGLILGLFIFAIMVVVYIPFVKAYDKQKLNEENATVGEE